VPGAHHSLTQKVPGVAFATLVQETREVPGFAEFCDVETNTVIGDTVVEVAEDGTITEVWNAFDDWEPDCHNAMGILTDVVGNDWTHINAIDYDAENDDWVLSFYWFGQLAVIDRATRAPVYRIGDFDGADCRIELARQHGAEFTDVGLALFDNNHAPAARMLELETHPEAGMCRIDTEVAHPDGLRASTLGDVDVVDGRWYTAWGDDGDVMVIDEGEIVWRALRSEEFFEDHGGFIALSVAYLPDLYPPAE
jgi:hypothetical protein